MICDFKDMASRHKVWLFDCDGVVLDSNTIKTEAFYDVAKPFGNDAAKLMMTYHLRNGGISRFKKFEWFLQSVKRDHFSLEEYQGLCKKYGDLVKRKLIDCAYTDGFMTLLNRLNSIGIKPYIISGGFQDELRDIFQARGVSTCFSGIYGSPRDKLTIFQDLLNEGVDISAGVFFGDAQADYDAASFFGMSFIFVRKYSESIRWLASEKTKSIATIHSFLDFES
jgi:phosphoglycolate phosphatase-like HAD superfamily hydrolase